LIAQKADGTAETISTEVLYYDLAADGSIYCLPDSTASPEKLLDYKLIEQIAV